MTYSTLELIISSLVVASALLSVIFTFGVVWRVEEELDISYKLFLGAILSFTAGVILELFNYQGSILMNILIMLSKILFSVLFLAGILTMRDLLRKMDGEKKSEIGPQND